MSIRKDFKYYIIKHVVTFPAYYLLNLYAKTIKLSLENKDEIRNNVENSGQVILASWHQRFFGGFYLSRIFNRPISIMISASKDGDFIADVVQQVGWVPRRGSGLRGGKQALRLLVKEIKNRFLCGHIADGPTGPAQFIKRGSSLLRHTQGLRSVLRMYSMNGRGFLTTGIDLWFPNRSVGSKFVLIPSYLCLKALIPNCLMNYAPVSNVK